MDGFSVGFLNNLPKLISLVLGLGTHQCDNLRTVAQNYFLFIFTTYVYMQVAINLTFFRTRHRSWPSTLIIWDYKTDKGSF